MPEYQFIDRQHQLDLAVSSLGNVEYMGVDTESSGYYTYFSELCLIQISAGTQHYIIDTLVGLDMDGLGRLFADPKITKIFHAAGSDITELRRDLGHNVQNVFDTMIACRMLGHASCSLQSLVKHYKNIELEKKEQKSNWKKRPLTRSQLDYANLDTVYLEELRETMSAELSELGLREEIQQEFDWIAGRTSSAGEPETPAEPEAERELDEFAWLKVRGAADLAPRDRGVLRELYLLRDQRARKENLASFRLVTNDALLRLVRRRPKNQQELGQLRVLHPAMLRKDGDRVLAALATTQEIPDSALPQPERDENPELRALVRRLKRWRGRIADYRGMDPSMIVTNKALFRIAESKPADLSDLKGLELLTEWKTELYGVDLLDIVNDRYNGQLPADLPRLPEEVRAARAERASNNGRK